MGNLLDLMSRKCLIEKAVSQSALDKLIDSFEKMDWQEKKKRAEDLIAILETSRTEEEILQRAERLYE